MARRDAGQPTIELGGRNPGVPHLISMEHGLHQRIDPASGKAGDRQDGDACQLRQKPVGIVLGKNSGMPSVEEWCEKLKIKATEERSVRSVPIGV